MTQTSDFLPHLIYDAKQVVDLDARLNREFGVDGFELMQRAARAAFSELSRRWPMPGRLVALCGPGNNGGDGALVALLAKRAGWQVKVIAPLDLSDESGDAAKALSAYRDEGGEIHDLLDEPIDADVIIDALLGTGLNRDVSGRMVDAIDLINQAADRGAGVLAIDIASGVDAGTGQILGRAVAADATISFIGVKLGLVTGDGASYCGKLAFDDLGAPDKLYEGQPYTARRIAHRDFRQALPARRKSVHKGENGHVLCLGGAPGMGGAIRLTAEAALRAGAGLVSVGCHRDHVGAMSQNRPELMCHGLGDDSGSDDEMARLNGLIEKADVVAVGPGLGEAAWGDALWECAVASDKPLVVDADALNRLAGKNIQRGNWILTPHPGEAARLLEWQTSEVVADRVQAVRTLAERYHATVVLKGAGTLIAAPDDLWLCTQGNPGMAVAGMGDLLTGIVAGFYAQSRDVGMAAVFGVYVHALAGDDVAAQQGERGMIPSDLLPSIRRQSNPAQL